MNPEVVNVICILVVMKFHVAYVCIFVYSCITSLLLNRAEKLTQGTSKS